MLFEVLLLLGSCLATQALPSPLPVRRVPWEELLPAGGEKLPPQDGTTGDIWKDCSHQGDPVVINSLSLNPDPPMKGHAFTIDANLTLEEVVTGGEAQIEVYYGIFELVNVTYDVCDLLSEHGQLCPLEKGIHIVHASQEISRSALSGLYYGLITVFDQNRKELICISLKFNL